MAQELETPTDFTINAFYEKLIQLRKTNERAFRSISPASKLALAQYERLKREHEHATALKRENDLPPAA